MVMCWAPNCNHYSERRTCRYFRFPRDPTLRSQWITRMGRDIEPSTNAVLCSCHFVDEDGKNLPTLSVINKQQLTVLRTPEKKKRIKVDKTTPKKDPVAHSLQIGSKESIGARKFLDYREVRVSPDPEELLATPSTSSLPDSGSSSRLGDVEDSDKLRSGIEKLNLHAESSVEAKLYFLQKENEKLKRKCEKAKAFTYEYIENDDKLINMYTGIPNQCIFDALFSLFEPLNFNYYLGWDVGKINKKDQLLMTLMKLRLNLLHMDLGCRFNCSKTTVTNVVCTWVHALHEILFKQLMAEVPSRRKNKNCMPSCFSTFTNCRIVLDCTEARCIKPTAMHKQRVTYSSYKHFNTVKGLVGVAPNGVVTFVSDLYPGSTSDKKIVQNSGILNKLVAGDLIIVDKGFLIKDLLPAGVDLNIPPFLTSQQFSSQQAIETRTIARARIHVERAIRRIKCYSILDSIPAILLPQATMIFQVCSALTNLQFPLIAEVEHLYRDIE